MIITVRLQAPTGKSINSDEVIARLSQAFPGLQVARQSAQQLEKARVLAAAETLEREGTPLRHPEHIIACLDAQEREFGPVKRISVQVAPQCEFVGNLSTNLISLQLVAPDTRELDQDCRNGIEKLVDVLTILDVGPVEVYERSWGS